ncbi:hypothetical protein AVEN_145791-1 [Araneus ventricosus]|uniref:Uncharacterized protein n=1 Tax=Araneus ventricosus TaxID=182803 RepID=A0A4Y2VXS9_ARAVE|nr:hypothetical protein AVEN_145791-1 [Araneus ventricosus]
MLFRHFQGPQPSCSEESPLPSCRGGDMTGHCVPTLHRKEKLCEEHKTTFYFVCFTKDAGISLEKNSFISLSFTYTYPWSPYQLMLKGAHLPSDKPGQSAAACESQKAVSITLPAEGDC